MKYTAGLFLKLMYLTLLFNFVCLVKTGTASSVTLGIIKNMILLRLSSFYFCETSE